MLQVLRSSWALLLGMLLLMIGNGLQGTLLGVRGDIESFTTFEMSIVISAYFLGFLGGSRLAPALIRRVGHVRVFAALASMVSAVLILYPVWTNPILWTVGRVLIGFCFSGIYVTAESWLNNAANNENRGKALSLYMIVQMFGIVFAQGVMQLGDPSGYLLFVLGSIIVSFAVTPILLSITPTPAFDTTKPMSIKNLIKTSPLGCVGMFLLGGIFSAQFGMAAVFGVQAGLSVLQISIFISTIYIGAIVLQYPIGWASDNQDRRAVITVVAALGGLASGAAYLYESNFYFLLIAAFIIGGTSNPLYSLLLAYTNDYLSTDDMAAASGGMVFINGLGAIAGPIITGWMMSSVGPYGFFLIIGLLMMGLAAYAILRMTQRAETTPVEETASYTPILPTASAVAVELASEMYIETTQEEQAAEGTDG